LLANLLAIFLVNSPERAGNPLNQIALWHLPSFILSARGGPSAIAAGIVSSRIGFIIHGPAAAFL
jgi:hypothetical protein